MTPAPQYYLISKEELDQWQTVTSMSPTCQELRERVRSRPYTSASSDVLEEVYEKYKHLDKCLSDTGWCGAVNGAHIYSIAGELWRAIKELRQQTKEREQHG